MKDYNELMERAQDFIEYSSIFKRFSSKIGEVDGKSCINCLNFNDGICNKISNGKN